MTELFIRHQNPDASGPLVIPVQMLVNTPVDVLFDHIRENSKATKDWVSIQPEHDRIAIICGSGASLKEHLEEIKAKQASGAEVFALNAAAGYLADNGILADAQVMIDAKSESVSLIGRAKRHYFGATVDPECFKVKPLATLFHLQIEDDELQEELDSRAPCEYLMLGTAVSVGIVALELVYALGYRKIECYGYDSSHRDGESHVVRQEMNDIVACMNTTFAGKDYLTSLPMKMQVERFMMVADALKRSGCAIEVHGDGLLPAMWKTPEEQLTEKEKYVRVWSTLEYRKHSPAEGLVQLINSKLPDGDLLDFGCGTGRAAALLSQMGRSVTMLDFAPNCRDEYAANLPFYEVDMTESIPLRAEAGYCVDVMEHIEPDKVERVVENITNAAKTVFFQISTAHDSLGELIGHDLHLSVHDHLWWKALLSRFGTIKWEEEGETTASFVVKSYGEAQCTPEKSRKTTVSRTSTRLNSGRSRANSSPKSPSKEIENIPS